MSGPVISFDLARSKGAVETVRVTSAPANTPETAPPDQDMTRAGLAVSYAGVIGADITTADMVEAMGALTPATSAADAMRAGLTASGLSARIEKTRRDRQQSWPAIALMSTGEVVLVLAEDGDKITLHDPSARGNCTNVDKDAFDRHFSGRVLKAELTPAQIAARHAVATKPAHWFWGEFPRFRRQIVEIGLGSFVANMLAVAVALFSLQVYDRVIPHQSEATLWVLALGAGLAILMESFLKMSRARLLDASGRKIEMRVQSVLMDRLLGMRAGQGGQTPSGLFSAMREFSSIREFFTASTIGGLTDLPFIFLFLALVASIAGPLVWVLIIGGGLMVIPSFFLQKRLVALTQATQGATVKSSRLLHEAIYEADTVKAHRGEERFRRLWSELTAVSSSASAESRKLSASLTFWSQGVQQATYVSAVVGGTFMVFAGQFTIGAIIAVGILTSRTLAPLTGLAGTLARWSNVKAALDALDQVAGAEQDHDPARTYLRRDRLHGGFELRGLRYAYEPDAAPTLDLEALQILPGQRLGVLGANGSGKSTLLRLLSGLATPTEGRVLIDGVDMGQLHPKDLRREIGYLSQEVRLFAGTLRDNLNLDQLERDDERMFDALEFAGLGAHVRAHAKGLDLEIRDGGAGLSIGQRQSIGWARLWLQDPQICLLDEPTAALDSSLEAALIERLSGWLEGRTAIIATHRVPILSLTTRTLMLAQGRLVVDGPRDEVLAHLARQKAS